MELIGDGDALKAARKLEVEKPEASAKRHGDLEAYEWWEQHADLLEAARRELGTLSPELYGGVPSAPSALLASAPSAPRPQVARWLQPRVLEALEDGSPGALRSVLEEACCDTAGFSVYRIDLFTDEFCDLMLAELDHLEGSGIPLRRPNGMNRYGAILSQLGFQEGLLEPLMRFVVLPFATMLWPEWVARDDCDETYGFVVRYKIGEDVDLAEHADTSNVTLNACLGREFTGGELYFKGCRCTASQDQTAKYDVGHKRGTALLHLGGHFHGVYPLTSGDRHNLVLWATHRGGVVRIRPTTPKGRAAF